MMRLFSGIQPSGHLHLGNYFGAIRNWVRLQDDFECLYCIVDYHALTQPDNLASLPRWTLELARDLIACGIDPSRSTLFVQSHVAEHTELAWILNCLTPFGDLTRMTQFKEKARRAPLVGAGLFNYPVLQAADILLYRAGRVPVGADQVQHLELARTLARRFNTLAGREFFPEPEPLLSEGRHIRSLADPARKMSKSLGTRHWVGVMEDPASIGRKIRSAVTDAGGEPSQAMSPGVENLFLLLRLSAPESVAEDFGERHQSGRLAYRDLKEAVLEHLERQLGPIRERRTRISAGEIRETLAGGASRARLVAAETMAQVRPIVGAGPHSLARLG